jgi:hypothetical protein
MKEEKKEGKKDLKVTRGYSLSRENMMALRAESLERTMATTDGSTVSASEVLDEIVTAWRETRALLKARKA